MTGRLAVVGLGPGDQRYFTAETTAALADAQALYGYGAYLDRVPARAGQSRHPSDNREEAAREFALFLKTAPPGDMAAQARALLQQLTAKN